MSRWITALCFLLMAAPTGGTGQVPVTVEQDLIFSRVEGAAVLADIAYPVDGDELPVIMYVHGGRWRAGSRVNDAGLQVAEWAAAGPGMHAAPRC